MPIELLTPGQIRTDRLLVVIHSAPGMGKTTLLGGLKNPLIIDCDAGSHRAKLPTDVAIWRPSPQALASVQPSDIQGYDAICLDTISKALPMLASSFRDEDGMSNRAGLTPRGFMRLGLVFESLLDRLRRAAPVVVVTAHSTERENKGQTETRVRSYGKAAADYLYADADLIGRIHGSGRRRFLSFDSDGNSTWAKNVGLRERPIQKRFALHEAIQEAFALVNQHVATAEAPATTNKGATEGTDSARASDDVGEIVPDDDDADNALYGYIANDEGAIACAMCDKDIHVDDAVAGMCEDCARAEASPKPKRGRRAAAA